MNITVVPSKIGNRCILKQSEAETENDGLIIPDTVKEKPLKGIIIAVSKCFHSPDGVSILPKVKEGDTVLYDMYAGTNIEIDGEQLLCIEEGSIFCILN